MCNVNPPESLFVAEGGSALRSHCCGKADDLAAALDEMVAGKETVVRVLHEGTVEDLRRGRAKMQGFRVGLKILDFDPKRDYVPLP